MGSSSGNSFREAGFAACGQPHLPVFGEMLAKGQILVHLLYIGEKITYKQFCLDSSLRECGELPPSQGPYLGNMPS
jgi:hypothetical protein